MVEEWLVIPGFKRYEVSNFGNVRSFKTKRPISQHECKTTKGTYLDVNIHDDQDIRRKISVHRLVCFAFHPSDDDYSNLDVDHIDDDKHNNHKDNLQWCNRSFNVKKAFLTGANIYSHKVTMYDNVDDVTLSFNSFQEVGEYFEKGRDLGLHIVLSHLERPYVGRYDFEVVEVNYVPNRTNTFDIYALDLKTYVFHRFLNYTQLNINLFYPCGLAALHLRKQAVGFYNGIVISKVEDIDDLQEFIKQLTKDELEKSIRQVTERNIRLRARFIK